MCTSSSPVANGSDRIVQAIFDYAARISRETRIEELVRLNADFARDLIGADRCSLWLADASKNALWTKVAHGVAPLHIPLNEGLVGACVRENRVLIVNDAERDRRHLHKVDLESGYRTEQVLCVPLVCDGIVIGALQLLNKAGGFSEDDAGLLGFLAHFAASAIESERLRQATEIARLMQRELDLAHQVQARMLPESAPCAVGLECVGFCRPARSVGGDYFDLLPIADGQFACTLGDVSGKGIPAAVMMASIQTLLRSLLQRDASNLGQVFADLNRTLFETSTPERYSTLFCGVVSADRSALSFTNAGHVPPYLLRSTGDLERLPGGGPPVAMLPGIDFAQDCIPISAGDSLIVVSDGIVEACNRDGDFWDESEIDRVLRANLGAPLAKIPELLCSAADRYAAGADQYDDMTVVAVRVK
jgi:sigma-B regulation protein RsbU (phosphoserine phosphatase)